MILISELTENDIGRWVIYTASDGHTERGRLKSWNDTGIFVVYNAAGNWDGDDWKEYTAAHTRLEDLEFEPCDHMDFEASAEVYRLSDIEGGRVTGFTAEVKVRCRNCLMGFQWVGLDRGIATAGPMVSMDKLTLRAPITPVVEL